MACTQYRCRLRTGKTTTAGIVTAAGIVFLELFQLNKVVLRFIHFYGNTKTSNTYGIKDNVHSVIILQFTKIIDPQRGRQVETHFDCVLSQNLEAESNQCSTKQWEKGTQIAKTKPGRQNERGDHPNH